jgi:hypothetical protein
MLLEPREMGVPSQIDDKFMALHFKKAHLITATAISLPSTPTQ